MSVLTHLMAFAAGGVFGMTAMALCIAAGRKDDDADGFCKWGERREG